MLHTMSNRNKAAAAAVDTGEGSARYRDILAAAATLFAERGYHATSIRDIGERVGLLGGSLYHHIKSKEALFVKIHDAALQQAAEKITQTLAPLTCPWGRLEAACVTLAELQLDPDSVTMPLMNEFRRLPPALQEKLIESRDGFEAVFTALVNALPLPETIDHKIYRISLLTLLNNLVSWYRPGGLAAGRVAHEIIKIFKPQNAPGCTEAGCPVCRPAA